MTSVWRVTEVHFDRDARQAEFAANERVGKVQRREIVLGARHSTIILSPTKLADAIEGRVYTLEPTGDVTFVHVRLGSDTVVISVPPATRFAPNAPVWLGIDQTKLHLFDAATGMALRAA